MKNHIGTPVREGNFYPRPKLIDKILSTLKTEDKNNAHISLNAPRRVGKSSVMHYLVDNPQEGFIFVMLDISTVRSSEDFFKQMLAALYQHEDIKKHFGAIFSLLEKASKGSYVLKWGKLELGKKAQNKSQKDFFYEILEKLSKIEKKTGKQIVLMIDEFTEAINNILKEAGKDEAYKFLQEAKAIRKDKDTDIQFILTGSISLEVMVDKVGDTKLIKDLRKIDVPPFSKEEAIDMIMQIGEGERIPFTPELATQLLEKVKWYHPYYIKIVIQEILTLQQDEELTTINIQTIEIAIENIVKDQQHKDIKVLFDKLKGYLDEAEQGFIQKVLTFLAKEESASIDTILTLSEEMSISKAKRQNVLNSMVYDGFIYLEKSTNSYQYNSPIMRLWWQNCKHQYEN